MVNILNSSLLVDEQSEAPVNLHDNGKCSGEGLTDGECQSDLLFEEPIGSMPTAKVRILTD